LEILGEACEAFGIRACLCYGATERNRGVSEARQGLEACSSFLRNTTSPLLRGAVGLHASFTVSDTTIREAGELCQKRGAIMHVHVAEDRADVRDAVARGYRGPLERLIELQALPPGSILAHGLYLNEEQVRRVAENNCWIVQNPRSNHGNQVGYPQALAASSLVALGTDGYPADMPAEADFLVQQATEHGEDKAAVQARTTAGNSLVEAMFGEPVGLPTADRKTLADLQIRDPSGVRHVFVHGRHVVKNGALAGQNLAEIEARAAEQATRLWQRMANLAN
ncbi:MAG: amidohydrolase family protein, partial [Nannocystaceae bacterium]